MADRANKFGELDGQWIEVFKAGDYGDKGTYGREELEKIAANYDPQLHEAPVVVGHPREDSPAYGWIEALRVGGNGMPNLEAKLRQVDEGFEALVKGGKFKQRSVALYADLAGKGLYLRHLGFLGAAPPEVKGLKSVFHDADSKGFVEIEEEEQMEIGDIKKAFGEVLESLGLTKKKDDPPALKTFTEAEVKAAEEAAATKAAADAKAEAERVFAETERARSAKATRASEVREFIAKLKPVGKWLPAFDKAGLVEFLESLPAEQTIEFGEEGKKEKASPYAVFQKFLEGLPKLVTFGELAAPTGGAAPSVQANETASLKVDPQSALIDVRAKEIAKAEKITFGEALPKARAEVGAKQVA